MLVHLAMARIVRCATGIASVLKAASPSVQVVGCQPTASHTMERCVAAGAVVQMPSEPTLSDGTAGACVNALCMPMFICTVQGQSRPILASLQFALP